MLVTLPSHLSGSTNGRSIVEAISNRDGPDDHIIVDVDFTLPSNPDQRFLRLVNTFNIHVVDATSETLAVNLSSTTETLQGGRYDPEYRKPTFDRRRLVGNEIQPRWKLWTTCHEDE